MSASRRLAVLLLLSLTVLAACDEDPAAPDGDITRLPATRDEAVAHLATAYEQRNIDAMALVLHEDYVFTFAVGSLYGTTWNRTDEIAALERLFEGLTGLDPLTNQTLSGVVDIDVYQRTKLADWQADGADFTAPYEMGVRFTLGDGLRYTVWGEQNFRVRQVTVEEDGETVQRWQLSGHEDLIPDLKRATDWSWGAFKRCYLR